MNEKERAKKIIESYEGKKVTALDELKTLDARVKRPAKVFAYTFGTIGALIMGAGMSLIMTDIADMLKLGDGMLPGIITGCVGLAMCLVSYPIYNAILKSRKKKYAHEIIELAHGITEEK